MARFNANEINNYSNYSQGGKKNGFFSLKNDKDTATVRFMYESADDIDGYTVHKVKVGDRERYVNCLREYNEPLDVCPFCMAKIPTQPKLFIPLYNEDLNQIQFWERGQKFYSQISSLVGRYKNIVSRVFDIERVGKPGDTKTTYNFYPVGDPDGTTVDDIVSDLGLESMPSPLGSIIMDKNAEDMRAYLDTGDFPHGDSAPIRRRATTDEPPFDGGAPIQRRSRRTPASNDTF